MIYEFEDRKPIEMKQNHLHLGGINPAGEEITLNSKYLIRKGKPWIPVMGEIHFSRLSRENWETELLKMKAGGITLISTYLFWIYHEETEGTLDFSGDNDIRTFLSLCQSCGLEVVLRIGPWAHGECRNGGFPDWLLQKGFPLRENNSDYLSYVQKWYHAISRETDGLLYQDGGPVVMIQLENELTDNAEHLHTLKRIAQKEGLIVPIYTVTGWNSVYGAAIPEQEVLPVFGGYPEAPWEKHIQKLAPSPNFFFHHIRNDSAIGRDVITDAKKEEGHRQLPYDDYPFATCELGGGIQVTHHRRPYIKGQDIYALSLVKIGCGNNLPGYYMYHGGTNKIGEKSTFQESKETGYPNDYPILSYDFQAPLGEFGLVRPQYRKLKLLHLFLQNFMEELAPMECYLGLNQTDSRNDNTSLRYAVRKKKNAGFVFVNQYQRLEHLCEHENVQFKVNTDDGELVFPKEGIRIKDGMSFILPFGLEMGTEKLQYATAQLLCRQENTYFFMALDGIDSVYQFENGSRYQVKAGLDSCIKIGDIQIVTLSQEQAEHLYQLAGGVIVSSGDCYKKGHTLVTYRIGNPDLTVAVWEKDHFEVNQEKMPEQNAAILATKIDKSVFNPELGKELCINKKREIRAWDISLNENEKDGYIRISYTGDVAQLYTDDVLVADDFYYGGDWLVPVSKLTGKQNTLFVSEQLPEEVYLEVVPDMTLWENITAEYVPIYKKEIKNLFG